MHNDRTEVLVDGERKVELAPTTCQICIDTLACDCKMSTDEKIDNDPTIRPRPRSHRFDSSTETGREALNKTRDRELKALMAECFTHRLRDISQARKYGEYGEYGLVKGAVDKPENEHHCIFCYPEVYRKQHPLHKASFSGNFTDCKICFDSATCKRVGLEQGEMEVTVPSPLHFCFSRVVDRKTKDKYMRERHRRKVEVGYPMEQWMCGEMDSDEAQGQKEV